MAESFSRQKSRHAPQKEGGLKILCDLPPVWPRLVRPTNLMSRTDGKKTHTHTQMSSSMLPIFFWYLLCKASQACLPAPGLRIFGSNFNLTLRASPPVVVNLKTLNRRLFAESQTLVSSTLDGSRSSMLPVSVALPSMESFSPLLRIGSVYFDPETILLRKG